MKERGWFKHGFWNTIEHGLTRVTDALSSLILIWALSPEMFSKLALAQAAVAPMLFLFVAPETVFYRDFAAWKSKGYHYFKRRLSALRAFSWLKAVFAFALSVLLASVLTSYFGREHAEFDQRFHSLLWAFFLVLSPQIAGADREFLRLELCLRKLNFVSLLQKLSLFGGTIAVAIYSPARLDLLAFVAVVSALISAVLAYAFSERAVTSWKRPSTANKDDSLSYGAIVFRAIRSFSIWQHLGGVIQNWVQTMDVFFMGHFGVGSRSIGLYAAVLKLAHFSTALPLALSNLFSVWIGRRLKKEDGAGQETKILLKYSFALGAVALSQVAIIYFLFPFVFDLLSRGRWDNEDFTKMSSWLIPLLVGGVILSFSYIHAAWLTVRTPIQKMFWRVYVLWGVGAAAIYGVFTPRLEMEFLAWLKVPVFCIFLALLGLYFRFHRKRVIL